MRKRTVSGIWFSRTPRLCVALRPKAGLLRAVSTRYCGRSCRTSSWQTRRSVHCQYRPNTTRQMIQRAICPSGAGLSFRTRRGSSIWTAELTPHGTSDTARSLAQLLTCFFRSAADRTRRLKACRHAAYAQQVRGAAYCCSTAAAAASACPRASGAWRSRSLAAVAITPPRTSDLMRPSRRS